MCVCMCVYKQKGTPSILVGEFRQFVSIVEASLRDDRV